MKRANILFILALFTLIVACKSQKETTTTNNTQPRQSERQGGRQGGPPSVDELLKMDSNSDGKLSKSEVKGPLLDQFSKIDTNGDNLLSREELENAPKPERGGQRPRQ